MSFAKEGEQFGRSRERQNCQLPFYKGHEVGIFMLELYPRSVVYFTVIFDLCFQSWLKQIGNMG